MSKVVVADFADESRTHSEDCRACNRVRCRASGYILNSQRFEFLEDTVSGFFIDVLHASTRNVVFVEERVVGKDREDVSEGISYAEDRFHISLIFRIFQTNNPQR